MGDASGGRAGGERVASGCVRECMGGKRAGGERIRERLSESFEPRGRGTAGVQGQSCSEGRTRPWDSWEWERMRPHAGGGQA